MGGGCTAALLPNNYTIVTAQNSQWSAVFTIYNDDGTLANITNKVFEFIVLNRISTVSNTLFSFSSVGFSLYGSMVVNTTNSSVQVIVNPAATNLLGEGGGPYTFWMDPNLPDQTALVTGVFLTQPVAGP
jgi:hypothetical protein